MIVGATNASAAAVIWLLANGDRLAIFGQSLLATRGWIDQRPQHLCEDDLLSLARPRSPATGLTGRMIGLRHDNLSAILIDRGHRIGTPAGFG
jgi:hypothetical protein